MKFFLETNFLFVVVRYTNVYIFQIKGHSPLIMKTILLFVILLQTWSNAIQLCPQHCSCKPVGAQAEWLRLKCGDRIQEIKDVDINRVSVELIQL